MVSRRNILMGGATLFGISLVPGVALAEQIEIYVTSDGVAINGADPVAYFTEENYVEGSPEFTTEYKEAIWQFSSAQNRDMFVADPEKYEPQYGGHCAFAMAFGSMATSVPEAWSIQNGKLYLNFSLSGRGRWREDPDKYIEMADENWPGFLS